MRRNVSGYLTCLCQTLVTYQCIHNTFGIRIKSPLNWENTGDLERILVAFTHSPFMLLQNKYHMINKLSEFR